MDLEPRIASEPAEDVRRLVRAEVFHDQMNIELVRNIGVDSPQPLEEFATRRCSWPMILPVAMSSAAKSVVVP